MINTGDLLTFGVEGKEVKCKVEEIAKDFSYLVVVDQPNTLFKEKQYTISITKNNGVFSAMGVVERFVKAGGKDDEKNGQGMLEYTVKITKPFQKKQKRNAYRFECYLPAVVFELDSTEMNDCHIFDLSSGGAKILTDAFFENDETINVMTRLGNKDMHMLATVLSIDKSPEAVKEYSFMIRVKFTQTTQKDEEAIVQYIFSEYRKIAQKRMNK